MLHIEMVKGGPRSILPLVLFLELTDDVFMKQFQFILHERTLNALCRKVGIDGSVGRNVHQLVDKRKRCVQSPSLMMA
jgi:hypothetical protein